jgi:ribulose 1,5-bisphosphate synthetase/thiazole synthase
MVQRIPETQPVLTDGSCDVAMVGAGMAGKAAALQLAKAGLKVICVSPVEGNRPPVGESLDWSLQ